MRRSEEQGAFIPQFADPKKIKPKPGVPRVPREKRRSEEQGAFIPQFADPKKIKPKPGVPRVPREKRRSEVSSDGGSDVTDNLNPVIRDLPQYILCCNRIPAQVWVTFLGIIITTISSVSYVMLGQNLLKERKNSSLWPANITNINPWQPRISRVNGFLTCLIPSLIAWTITLVLLSYSWKNVFPKAYELSVDSSNKCWDLLKNECCSSSNNKCCSSSDIECCGSPNNKCCRRLDDKCGIIRHFFLVHVLTTATVLWDAVDVSFDTYLFYILESGNLIDSNVHISKHASGAILAFALLGCLKICVVFGLIVLSKTSLTSYHIFFDCVKLATAYSFLFEDGPEMIVEYFYVEKYVTDEGSFLLVRNSILLFVFFMKFVFLIKAFVEDTLIEESSKKRWRSKSALNRYFIFIGLGLGIVAFICRILAGFIRYSGPPPLLKCFDINFDEGIIHQNPFNCLSGLDITVLVLCSLALLLLLIGFLLTIDFVIQLWKNFKDDSGTETEKPSTPTSAVDGAVVVGATSLNINSIETSV